MFKKLLTALAVSATLLLPVVAQATILFPTGGGTGSSSLTGILIGNGVSPVNTLTIGSGLTLTGTTLTSTGGGSSTFGTTSIFATTPLQWNTTTATLSILQAGTSQNGYLSSTDWNTFNGKQASGNYLTALTGDGTASGPGSAAFTLATVNSNVGTFNNITLNAKGLATAASNIAYDTFGYLFPGNATTSALTFGGITLTGAATGCATFTSGVLSSTGVTCGSGSGAVSSVTGTANQVVSSPTTGAVVVSLPNHVIFPTGGFESAIASVTNATTTNFEFTGKMKYPGNYDNFLVGVDPNGFANPVGVSPCSGGQALISVTGNGATCSSNTATYPLNYNGGNFLYQGLGTTTPFTQGQVAYVTNSNTIASTPTTTVTCTGNATCATFATLGASPVTINVSSGTAASSTLLGDSNTFSGTLNQFSNTIKVASLGGFIGGNGGTLYNFATSTIKTSQLTNDANFLTANQTITLTGAVTGSGATAITTAFGTAGANTVLSNGTGATAIPTFIATSSLFQNASASASGLLTSTDWSTFNSKQPAGNYLTALTGDVTASGPGSVAATLATVNSNVGTFTYPSVTVNGKGLITSISNGTAPTTYTGAAPITVTGSIIGTSFSTSTFNAFTAENTFTNLFATNASSTNATTTNLAIVGAASNCNGISALTTNSSGVVGCTAQPQGTVTAVSVASTNGFAGSSSGGATPALTLTTTITGLLKGNGTAISAASNGTDYSLITALTCGAGQFFQQATAAGVFTCGTPAGTTYTGTFPIQVTGSVIASLFSTTSNSGMAQGFQYVGSGGIFQSAASSSLFGFTPQPAGNYLTALTGDGTASGPGSAALTLATVNGNIGSFTNANITVNAKGLITAASNGTAGGVTSVTATYPLASSGGTTPNITTAFGTTTNNGIAAGSLYIGSGGIFQSTATGTISNGTGISVTAGQSVIGSGLTITNTGVISLGNGTGTTCSGTAPGTCNVNTTQNITTLSNLTTAGTVNTTASGVLYTTGTSTITNGSGIAYSGTMGSEIGGVSGTLSVSGLTTSNFASANVSQFTNDAGYLTSATGVTSVKQTYGTAQVGALTFATTSASFNGLTVADAITNSGGTFTITPLWSGTLNNAGLTNSSVTVNTGTGLSGGGAVSLGGTALSLANTGVISNSCSSGISCSGTNPSTFTNTGVTSIVAGTNVTISGATGAVTINATGGGSSFGYPFTNPTEFGTTTAATTTPIWAQGGLFASSTSVIASTTFTINGNVGIGTSSPVASLTIASKTSTDQTPALVIDGATGSFNADMQLNRGSNTGTEEANIDFATAGIVNYQLGIQNNSTSDFELWDGSNDPVFTVKSGTNSIGFGSSTPFGDFAINADFGDAPGLIFNVASSSQSGTTSVFAINSNGYVMIGTTTPTVGTATFAEVISNSVRSLGGLAINTWTNVTNAFSIINAAGTTVFNVDTTATNPFLGVGTTTPWATASVVGDGTDPVFAVSTSTSNNVLPNFEIDQNGHVVTSGPKPTCTTSCTFGQGNDNAFRVTSGTAVTSEVVTFSKSWGTNAPICQATEGNNTAVPILVAASSTPTTVTLTNAALTTRDIDVICEGIQ